MHGKGGKKPGKAKKPGRKNPISTVLCNYLKKKSVNLFGTLEKGEDRIADSKRIG